MKNKINSSTNFTKSFSLSRRSCFLAKPDGLLSPVFLFSLFFFFVFLLASNVLAQEDNTTHKSIADTTQQTTTTPNAPQVEEGDVKINDNNSNVLLRIVDEGNFGAIELKTGTPSTTTNKLYNVGGTLHFGNNALGSGGASSINDLSDAQDDGSSLFIGYGAGGTNDDGGNLNTAVGRNSLNMNTTGNKNTATGFNSLHKNTTGNKNTATGYYSLYSNETGERNTATGNKALYYNTSGYYNTATGYWSLQRNTTGNNNTANGYSALTRNTTGNNNTGIGYYANFYNQEGSRNTIVGFQAGRGSSDHNKTGNIFLGYQAGYHEISDNKLYIENSISSTPLIWGDFANDLAAINGKLGVGTMAPTFRLHVADNSGSKEVVLIHNTSKVSDSDGMIIRVGIDVNPTNTTDYLIFQTGDASTIGVIDGDGSGGINYGSSSDRRLKTKIRDYEDALQALSKIQVRLYERKNAPGIDEVGFIAQEIQKVYPQIVSGSPDNDVETNPMMVDYGKITPLLVKAIQEQQKSIKKQVVSIKKLEKENEKIRVAYSEIRNQNEELKKVVLKNASLEADVVQLKATLNKILNNSNPNKMARGQN